MDRTKMVKEIIGEAAKELGFYYDGCSRDGTDVDYTFERKKEDEYETTQMIWIMIFGHYLGGWEIRMTFDGTGRIEAYNLIESDFKDGDLGGTFWFKDDGELERILYHFRRIILEKGEEEFRKLRKPPEENRARAEMRRKLHWKLYQEHEALNETYRKLYGMEDTEFTIKLIRRMGEVILERKDETFEEVEELLIGMAAVYGDQLIRKCGGEWVWDDERKRYEIYGIAGWRRAYPLDKVIGYWKKKPTNILINDFKDYSGGTIR